MGDDKAVRLLKNQKERRCSFMYDLNTPLWERYLMTIEEASSYFRIGENKLRRIASEYKDECVVMNGNRMLIKKKKFEHMIDKLEEI